MKVEENSHSSTNNSVSHQQPVRYLCAHVWHLDLNTYKLNSGSPPQTRFTCSLDHLSWWHLIPSASSGSAPLSSGSPPFLTLQIQTLRKPSWPHFQNTESDDFSPPPLPPLPRRDLCPCSPKLTPHPVQSMLNLAAQVILLKCKSDHVVLLLKTLQWPLSNWSKSQVHRGPHYPVGSGRLTSDVISQLTASTPLCPRPNQARFTWGALLGHVPSVQILFLEILAHLSPSPKFFTQTPPSQ